MRKVLEFAAWPMAILFTLSLGLLAHAQEEEVDVEIEVPAPTQAAAPKIEKAYWLGILGGEVSPELRVHLGLEGGGVLIREVVPDSPAAQGGIEQYDILLAVNSKPVVSLAVVQQEVNRVGGKQDGKLVFDLLHHGEQTRATVVPAERPVIKNAPDAPFGGQPFRGGAIPQGGFKAAQPFGFRMFGPGVAVGGANVNVNGPGQTSVQVNTQNGKTTVKVSLGEKTWEVQGASVEEALKQLPPEVRPQVEPLVNGHGVNVNVDVEKMIPNLQGMFEGFGDRRDARLQRRLERMQREIEELRQRLGAGRAMDQPPAAAEGEAPRFEPKPPAPADLPPEEGE